MSQSCVSVKNSISVFTLLLLSSGILMPSGSIFGFNIKISISILIFILIIIKIIRDRKINKSLLFTIFYIGLFIALTSIVSLINNVPIYSVKSQISAILSTILPVLFGWYLLIIKYYTKDLMINFLIIIIAIYSLIKITVIVSIYFGFFSIIDYINLQKIIFGVQPIYLQTDSFARINEASDYIIPWAIIIALRNNMSNQILRFVLLCILISAIILSYSRYLWVYSFFVILMYFLVPDHNLLKSINIKKIKRKIFLHFIILFIALFVIPWIQVLNTLEERFFGKYAAMSDLPREWMFNSLMTRIAESPLIGGGMGSFDMAYIRFDNAPWNYELQWLALTANFGIFFVAIILLILGIWITNVLYRKYLLNSDKVILILLALGWLFVGFFNCFLLNSAAGVIFFSIFVLGVNKQKTFIPAKHF